MCKLFAFVTSLSVLFGLLHESQSVVLIKIKKSHSDFLSRISGEEYLAQLHGIKVKRSIFCFFGCGDSLCLGTEGTAATNLFPSDVVLRVSHS